jgi:uncharacterized DUF497 family protein
LNGANIRKHFRDAEEIFRGEPLAEPDMRHDHGEKRWRGLGLIGGRTLQVVFSGREPETIRIQLIEKGDQA